MSQLGVIVSKLESGGGRYAGAQPASMSNPTYGQYPAFVQNYGSGDLGVQNYAQAYLTANPNATVGDFYAGYVLGTGTPSNPGFHSFNELQTTSVPGAQGAANNFVQNSGVDPNTPLSQYVTTGEATAYPETPLQTPDIGAQSESGSSLDSITGANESDLFGTTGSGGIGSDAVAGGTASASDNSPFPSSPLDTPTPESFSGGQTGNYNPSDQIQFNQLGGQPLTITNAADIGQQGSQDVSKAVSGLNQGVQTAEAKGAATATSLTQSWFGAFTDILARGGFIVVGLVILAGAFSFYYMEGKNPVAVVKNAI